MADLDYLFGNGGKFPDPKMAFSIAWDCFFFLGTEEMNSKTIRCIAEVSEDSSNITLPSKKALAYIQ